MRNLIFIFFCSLLIIGIIVSFPREKNQPVSPLPAISATPEMSAVSVGKEQLSLFVPYWSASILYTSDSKYDQLIYFGITPTINGLNTQDSGYQQLKKFVAERPDNMQSALTIRMLDNETNFSILKDTAKQRLLIKETMAVAKEHSFDGIVLDLELSALPFDSLIKAIVKKYLSVSF